MSDVHSGTGAPLRRRHVIQFALSGAAGLVGASLLAACGTPAAATSTTASSAASSAAPSTSAAVTTSSAAPATTTAVTTSAPATSSAAATTSSAASTTTAAAITTSATTASATASTTAAVTTSSAASTTSSAAANVQPQTGGLAPTPRNQTVIIDQSTFNVFDSFNPFIPNGQEYEAGFQQVCKEFLFYANYAAGKIEPWLGTKWTYNSDFTQLTFNLNPKAHWNDGQPVTSADLVFSIQMFQKDATLLGGTDIRTYVDSVTTPDAQTVVLKLKQANPRMHYDFICGIVGGFEVVPQHIWSKVDPTTFKDNPPVRSGPYKLDQVIPNQLMFVWKKDPNYWNKAVLDPKPEYVVYRSGPVTDSAVKEFQLAQTDLAGFDYPHMQTIQAAGYKNILIESAFRDPCPRGMWLNSDPSRGILADVRMHSVVSKLIDRKTIGSSVWLIQTPPAQYPWADYKSNDVWTDASIAAKYPMDYNPQEAATLLDQIGATMSGGKRSFQGKPITIEIMTPVPVGQPEYEIGQMVATELSKLGIATTVRSYSNPVWTQKWNTGQFDISSHWLCGVSFDPDQLYTTFEISKLSPIGQTAVNGNNVRLHDQVLSDLATKLDAMDPTSSAAKDLFTQALTEYYKALPAVPIIQTTYPTAYNTTYWTNWPTNDNLYQVPANWWGQFLFVIGKIQPTGHA